MKIEKGHYVPKELITSEALHEAVVKCFVAAGFVDDRPEYGDYEQICGAGLCVAGSGRLIWGGSVSCETPLTLHQLFTAENGLQWPDWALDIRTDDHCVWFDGVGRADVISGDWSPVKSRVLATRQANASTQPQSLTHGEEGLTHEPTDEALEIPDQNPELSWYERGERPTVGVECEVYNHVFGKNADWEACKILWSGNFLMVYSSDSHHECSANIEHLEFRPLDHATRKAELERKRTVDAAAKVIIDEKQKNAIEALYDAGMLVMPK